MRYTDKYDHMTNASLRRYTWKWAHKLFFHLLDLTILNSFITLTSHSSKWIHWLFKTDITQVVPWTRTTRGQGRLGPSTNKLKWLDARYNKHWPLECKRTGFCACSTKHKETGTKFKHPECNMRLCLAPHHIKLHFWGPTSTKLRKWTTQA
jgi:hypothetical protein